MIKKKKKICIWCGKSEPEVEFNTQLLREDKAFHVWIMLSKKFLAQYVCLAKIYLLNHTKISVPHISHIAIVIILLK